MLNKYRTLFLGAMLGLGTLAFSGAGASAAAMLPLGPIASGEANAVSNGIVQVKHENKWHKKNFNNNCFYKNGGCYKKHRNKHRRHHDFDDSYLFLPLIIGGGYGAYNYYDYDDGYDDDYGYVGVSSKHVRWCLNRYPNSYNPRTNLWVANSGKKYQCDSPYY